MPLKDRQLVLVFFLFRPRADDGGGGSQGISLSPSDLCAHLRHHRQTRFGHARGKRKRPKFQAHSPVRRFESGLSLGRGDSSESESATGLRPSFARELPSLLLRRI